MSDPIDKLSRLGDALEGAPMPLPASEIRARGDRIRHRRHAIIGGVSAAVVAAVAIPVVALTLEGDSSKEPQPADPSGTDSVPAPALELSEENLLTSKDAIYPNGGSDWQESDTFAGDGQATAFPCQQSTFDGLGAGPVFQREFEFVVTDTDEVAPGLHLNEVVAEFPSSADAQAAYDEIRGWYADCLPPEADHFNAGTWGAVPIEVDGTAELQLSTYGPVEGDEFDELGVFYETGLVVSGDRIAVLSQLVPGQDYNWPDGGTPVELMLPVAAERLVLGNSTAEPTDAPTPSTDWPTAIPTDFPLDSGWPQDDGSSEFQLDQPSEDNQAMIPAGELQACVFSPVDPGALDRLTARLSYGSDNYVRELQLFPTDQEAVTYVAQLHALYEGCPTDDQNGAPPTFTTEVNDGSVGDESLVITRASDGIGRVVINVVRIGNGVVVDLASDEGTGDTVIDLATETRENLADVIAAMTDLQGGSSSGNPSTADPNAPAGTTAIPTDFELDWFVGAPPVADSETTITGPEPGLDAVGDLPICGVAPLPTKPADRLGYSVAGIEYGDVRELRTYETAQAAVDELQSLRDRLADCDREPAEQDGWSKVWRTFDAGTGYDSVVFGYTTEMDDSDSFAPAGQLMTAIRVGNAILIMAWYAEYSAESLEANVPNLLATAALVTQRMCIFTADGC